MEGIFTSILIPSPLPSTSQQQPPPLTTIMMYPIGANEDPALYDICPFDPVHRILKSRMTTHISRCKNQHKDFKPCPFNSNHWSKNMQEHLAMCPQKNSIAQTMKIKKEANFVSKETCNVVCDEEWGDDDSASYDPTVKLATSDVIRVDRKLMPKAERKAFAETERIRLNQIRNNK